MPTPCSVCRAPIDDTDRFCASCGTPTSSQSVVTGLAVGTPVAAGVGRLVSSDAVPVGGFTPGVVIANRYRIIGLLGRGGMGEVYRADDLKLGHAVALKFLPPALADDPVRRERFFAEVRIARQISHPNVCRVYDIAEVDGRHFLSMEYVDGEDLSSLLQRIGSLPGAKAVDIARQLCAGVAAAHEKGVLHRDLKPANIMLDGRGRVRITDFGLAVAADEEQEAGLSGTPAYMAPEQLAGGPATVRSDVYALGLVLYELYTGKRAFTAPSLAELRIQKEHQTPTAPSEISRDLDPIVERVIQRCIDKDPRNRPASVLHVAAALPGGDPLAAALAAGETPSPEMVAAAASSEGLRPLVAWALAGLFVAGVVANVVLGQKALLFRRFPLVASPAVMVERAREILRAAGHAAPADDSAYGVFPNIPYLRYVQANDRSHDSWDRALPEATIFWYRQAPRTLMRTTDLAPGVTEMDPPRGEMSGDVTLRLDASGQLRDITGVPPQVLPPGEPPASMNWPVLLRAAGISDDAATPATPEWAPLFFAESRVAWTASMPGAAAIPIRVEATSFAGRATNFFVIPPWVQPTRVAPVPAPPGQLVTQLLAAAILGVLFAGSVLFARRNLRLGRGDRRGATRLAVFAFGALMAAWIIGEDHGLAFWEIYLFVSWTGFALFAGALFWMLYVAVEPFIRRTAPGLLVSWSRLLAGGFDDPLVGRDVLIGCAAGCAVAGLMCVALLLPTWMGRPAEMLAVTVPIVDVPGVLMRIVFSAALSLFMGLAILFLLFVSRLVLRREFLAVAAVIAVLAAPEMAYAVNPGLYVPLALAGHTIVILTLARVGLLAAVVAGYTVDLLYHAPSMVPFGAWHSALGATMVGVVVVLALYGFYRSLAGRSPFGSLALDA